MPLRSFVAAVALLIAGQDFASAQSWGNACNDGRVDLLVDDFDSTSGLALFRAHPIIPDASLSTVTWCRGQALAIRYDLTNVSPIDGQSWIVVQRSFAAINVA